MLPWKLNKNFKIQLIIQYQKKKTRNECLIKAIVNNVPELQFSLVENGNNKKSGPLSFTVTLNCITVINNCDVSEKSGKYIGLIKG